MTSIKVNFVSRHIEKILTKNGINNLSSGYLYKGSPRYYVELDEL